METTLNNQSLAGDFIPLTWKEWHALLRGIGEGWIAPSKDSEANLLDVITNIEAGAERSFKGFPLDILKQENPSLVMDEIGEAAGKVAEAYSRAKPALESFHDTIAERLSSIAKDCDITIRMKALFDSAKDNFSIDEAVALHTLASGHSFKELALDVFVDMIRINSSVGSKSGILCCITRIKITNINSTANPHLQLKNVVMTPPKSGPTAAEMETITLSIAKANVRFSPVYIPLIRETVAGVINAPAIPSINAHPINNTGVLQLIAAVNVPTP